MLDRESKREKILEGKLREIKIKLKKQQEEEARAAELMLRQAENAAENIKAQEDAKAKPSMAQSEYENSLTLRDILNILFLVCSALIGTAENEFNLNVEEEIQRRIKEQETQDQQDKMRKSPRLKTPGNTDTTGPESDSDDLRQSQDDDLENGSDHLATEEARDENETVKLEA